MAWDLSPDEHETIALIARLARERFAPRAAQYDAENRFPDENYADLREHGLMGLTVPKVYGGKGLSSLAYSLAMGEMAKGDSSTALTFNMHATVLTLIDGVGSPAQKERYFTEVVKRGAIFASIGSEPNASPNARTFFIETRLTETAGGYRINGTKHFCSFGNAADYYFVYAMRDGTSRIREGLLSVVIPHGTPGVEVVEIYNGGSIPGEDDLSVREAERHGYRGIAGSDSHIVSRIGLCATEFAGTISTIDDVVAALNAGTHEARTWRT